MAYRFLEPEFQWLFSSGAVELVRLIKFFSFSNSLGCVLYYML